ncbi:uncharacterized protein B0H18DRAFT_864068, partial [Fomitopsis serialis]
LDREQIRQALFSGASVIVSYMVDVLRIAFRWLKRPLGVLTFVVLLVMISCHVAGKLSDMLSPVCLLPGISSSMVCARYAPNILGVGKTSRLAGVGKVVELHSHFEAIMDANRYTNGISLKLKQSEVATRDLVTLVRASDLRSRDILAEALMELVKDAKKAGEGLYRLSAKIDGAVDRIVAVNDHAMLTIEAATVKEGLLPWLATTLMPHLATGASTVVRSYANVMETLVHETQRMLSMATTSAADLEQLQGHLLTIHEVCLREGIFGGNRYARQTNEAHLALLKEALAHVIATRDALQMLVADVEELRDRSAAPGIVGERVPVEALVRSVSYGIERLKEGR